MYPGLCTSVLRKYYAAQDFHDSLDTQGVDITERRKVTLLTLFFWGGGGT